MPRLMILSAVAGFLFGALAARSEEPRRLAVRPVEGAAAAGTVEVRGVAGGPFDPSLWRAGGPPSVPDVRRPLISPREGAFRNIYAPSAVEVPGGWDVYYGGWDGVPTGNDRIYRATTADFVDFGAGGTVIEHGAFQHVCNVNGLRLGDGGTVLTCTAYPDAAGTNKPAVFRSADGRTWNGAPAPYAAAPEDLVRVEGYEGYADADINGVNVMLHEDAGCRLYFSDYRRFGKVHRASGPCGGPYRYEGVSLAEAQAVNDVKKFAVGGKTVYLMGLHMNRDTVRFALSEDGMSFSASNVLFRSLDEAERYIVAVGWVVRGAQETPGRSILGVLYGAGASSSLAQNRIFARWFQRRAVFVTAAGQRREPSGARGPDRQILPLGAAKKEEGRFALYAEDGTTRIAVSPTMTVEAGRAYALEVKD